MRLDVGGGLVVGPTSGHVLHLEIVPQCRDELGGGDRAGVVCEQSQHKHAVLAQVVTHERRHAAPPVVLVVQSIHER